MNNNELIISLIKMLTNDSKSEIKEQNNIDSNDIFSRAIGKYVIVRSRNEGVNCGFLVAANNRVVVLKDARRLYFHRPKDVNLSWYEGVSESGLSDDSKISSPVIEKIIVEDYSITICSDIAKESLINAKTNEQS